jgi:hypothetical protein
MDVPRIVIVRRADLFGLVTKGDDNVELNA